MFIIFYILLIIIHIINGMRIAGIPPELTKDDDVISAISNEIASTFFEEYWAYMKNGYESPNLKRLTHELRDSHSTKDIFTKNILDWNRADQFFMCTTCRATLNVISRMFRSEEGELNGVNAENATKSVIMELCERFKLATTEVCSGLFDLNWPVLHHVIMNTNADARSICGSLPISFCSIKQKEFDWHVKVNKKVGLLTKPKSEVPQKTSKDLHILQLTDIHYDPKYKFESLAECPEPLCCRYFPKDSIPPEKKAGYWGDYRECDPPLYMIENAFDHVVQTHELDYIYYTGDTIPHVVWETTKEGNKQIITELHNLMVQKFGNIPVYPAIGNHEPHPTNLFGLDDLSDELSTKWLLDHLWSLWSSWLPSSVKETFLKGGYYTVVPKKGFRIISLNNNDCYILNWWMFYNGNNVSLVQLQWLHDTLLEAENAGEYVHILAHIPSGSNDCWTIWAREFNRIIERFNRIIGGIFNGHTHADEMIVHYSQNNHAMAISWNAGSLTPYSNKNPNYRVYEVEPKTYQIVDHETWIFNLTEANEQSVGTPPNWFREYKFSEFTTDLSPQGVNMLLDKMASNPSLLHKYWTYKVTSADPTLLNGCDQNCLLKTICNMAVSYNDKRERCDELTDKLNKQLAKVVKTEVIRSERRSVNSSENEGNAATSRILSSNIVPIFILYTIYQIF